MILLGFGSELFINSSIAIAIFFNVPKGPGYGCGCVFNIGGGLDLGMQSVIHCHHCDSFFLQFLWHTAVACLEASTMEPNQSGKTLEVLGAIDIQLATFFHVVIQLTGTVEDIGGGMIKGLGLLGLDRGQEKQQNENG